MQSDKQQVRDLVAMLASAGVQHVVISPGSRNAPLSISLHHHPDITTHVVVDERSAGYIAFGMAQQLAKPVAVCCTSGTASMNYGPAVAEAYYQSVPLLLLTADRPVEYIGQGEGQSIQQKGLFSAHVRFDCELREGDDKQIRWHNTRLIRESIIRLGEGPVHINIPMSEGLYGVADLFDEKIEPVILDKPELRISSEKMEAYSEQYKEKEKVLILIGTCSPSESLQRAVDIVAGNSNTLVLTETTANVVSSKAVPCIDRLIMTLDDAELSGFHPDLLITIGHSIISKKIKALLRDQKPSAHWHVGERTDVIDTYQSLTNLVQCDPAIFLQGLGDVPAGVSSYNQLWNDRDAVNKDNHDDYVEAAPYSDFVAFSQILDQIPGGTQLQMGNSSVVRYVQLFNQRDDLEYFANRGTSGIDGCTSTALGASLISDKPVTLISGDLAFVYDNNALWNDLPKDNLKIIVINNGGGGIFRIIDGPSKSGLADTYFEAAHEQNMEHLARHHGVQYLQADDPHSLEESLKRLNETTGCAILEVLTPREVNDAVLKAYFAHLKSTKGSKKVRTEEG